MVVDGGAWVGDGSELVVVRGSATAVVHDGAI